MGIEPIRRGLAFIGVPRLHALCAAPSLLQTPLSMWEKMQRLGVGCNQPDRENISPIYTTSSPKSARLAAHLLKAEAGSASISRKSKPSLR
jgi:hypothetical protein